MALITRRRAAGWIPALITAIVIAGGIAAYDTELLAGGKRDSRVIKLKKKRRYAGCKPAELSARWWQWACSAPLSANPLLDETGASVEVGQSGDTWFLCGVFNESGTATRTATIPEGVCLFFPIVNAISFDDGLEPRFTEEDVLESVAVQFEDIDVDSMFVEIDGVPVKDLHKGKIFSKTFSLSVPEDCIFDKWYPYDRSIFWPAASSGYWMMLNPLSTGSHTLRFGGTMGGFGLDITYHLTVVQRTVP